MGPLAGVRILELAGLGAAPYGCMMLADMGAEVVRIERPVSNPRSLRDPQLRNRRSVVLDLKKPEAVEVLLGLVESADVIIEAYRPGVAERLGIGPEVCLARNPRIIYGRMTGWGQSGPLAQAAGHDMNYIALTGMLSMIGPRGGKPVPPYNVVGDFGGGGLLMAYGLVCALLEARQSGKGQVVDVAMIDGAISFMGMTFENRANGNFREGVGENVLTGAAHYYDTYETSDGKFVCIAPIESQFYALLIDKLGLDRARFIPAGYPALDETTRDVTWPALKGELAAVFRSQTRDEWCALLEGTDVCFAPVLGVEEATRHPHNVAREAFIEVDGIVQNAPAPRFSRTVASRPTPPRMPGADSDAVLSEWKIDAGLAARARASGGVR